MRTESGYGIVSLTLFQKKRNFTAHRLHYMAANNRLDLPRNEYVCHTCDNPACINLEHLYLSTPVKKSKTDFERKPRSANYRHHTRYRKLNAEQVNAIRNATGKMSHIADEFGISVGYASKLRSGKAKKLVT